MSINNNSVAVSDYRTALIYKKWIFISVMKYYECCVKVICLERLDLSLFFKRQNGCNEKRKKILHPNT